MSPCHLPILLATLLLGLPAGANPPELCLMRGSWKAVVPPEEVRDALALREPRRRVSVCDALAEGACALELKTTAARTLMLRVSCGQGGEARDQVALEPREGAARRVAVQAATLLDVTRAPPPMSAPVASPTAVPAEVVPNPVDHDPTVALQLRAGTLLAPSLPGSTSELVLEGRWFIHRRVHLLAGVKLASALERFSGSESIEVADRAAWFGAGYRVEWKLFFLDLSVAGQYTFPVLSVEGGDGTRPVEEAKASRLALRGALGMGFKIHHALALVADVAQSVSLVERDINLGSRDALELGYGLLEFTAGLEARF